MQTKEQLEKELARLKSLHAALNAKQMAYKINLNSLN